MCNQVVRWGSGGVISPALGVAPPHPKSIPPGRRGARGCRARSAAQLAVQPGGATQAVRRRLRALVPAGSQAPANARCPRLQGAGRGRRARRAAPGFPCQNAHLSSPRDGHVVAAAAAALGLRGRPRARPRRRRLRGAGAGPAVRGGRPGPRGPVGGHCHLPPLRQGTAPGWEAAANPPRGPMRLTSLLRPQFPPCKAEAGVKVSEGPLHTRRRVGADPGACRRDGGGRGRRLSGAALGRAAAPGGGEVRAGERPEARDRASRALPGPPRVSEVPHRRLPRVRALMPGKRLEQRRNEGTGSLLLWS